MSYVRGKYEQSCVVFDGYEQGPSIKDHEHQRRAEKVCADIQLWKLIEFRKSFLQMKRTKISLYY